MVMTLRPSLKRAPPFQWYDDNDDDDDDDDEEIVPIMIKNLKKKKPQKPDPNEKGRAGPEPEAESSSEEEEREMMMECGDDYESVREERMRENRERMEKLGILSLSSHCFKKNGGKLGRPKKKMKMDTQVPFLLSHSSNKTSLRRSHRLKNVARLNFFERERSLKQMGISIPAGWKPEVYTKDDVKLLGEYKRKWKLDVDGVGEDGDLLYDPVNGTSCHQCRYKTLRKHTYCRNCRSAQGTLCGDCLYTRYGENVLETSLDPYWSCPVCRGICNCSRCRREKGWMPITIPYRKVVELGFKSVAHYLILRHHGKNKQKKPGKGDVVIELSSDTQESDSDDCDKYNYNSKDGSENMKQSVEKLVDVKPETVKEVADVTGKNELHQGRNGQTKFQEM